MTVIILKDKSYLGGDTLLCANKGYWDNSFITKAKPGDTLVIYPLKGKFKLRGEWLKSSVTVGVVSRVERNKHCTAEEWVEKNLRYPERIHFNFSSLGKLEDLPKKIFEKIDSMRQDRYGILNVEV